MNIAIWLLVGGFIGLVASILMGTNGRQGLVLNVVVGIVGAFLGGLIFGAVFDTSTINQGNLSIGAFAISLLGAVILLALAKAVRGVAR